MKKIMWLANLWKAKFWLLFFNVHIFWEGHKVLRNLHRRFVLYSNGQIYGGDFTKFCGLLRIYELYQGRHGEFEPGKVQYSTPKFFDQLFLIRAYWNPKSRQGPNLACLPCRGGPAYLFWISLVVFTLKTKR